MSKRIQKQWIEHTITISPTLQERHLIGVAMDNADVEDQERSGCDLQNLILIKVVTRGVQINCFQTVYDEMC